MRTFADLIAATNAALTDPATTGATASASLFTIEVDLQAVGPGGGVSRSWSVVASGVTATFLAKSPHADRTSTSHADLWPAGPDRPADLAYRYASFPAAPTYTDPDDGTLHLLDGRCSLLHADPAGVAHRYLVLGLATAASDIGSDYIVTLMEIPL